MKRPRRAPKKPVKKTARKPTRKQRVAKIEAQADAMSDQTLVDAIDPFRIDPADVPAGKSYQWHRETMATRDLVRDGWMPVPFDRHPGLFPAEYRTESGGVACNGLALLENSEEWVRQQLDLGTSAAKEMEEVFYSGLGVPVPNRYNGCGFPILPDSFIVSEKVEAPAEDGPPIVLPIHMYVRVPTRWAHMAAHLKLTPGEYARRRIIMQRAVVAPTCDAFEIDGVPVYEMVNLEFSPRKDDV